ncbi:DedA family protein [Geobacter sp. DSM 9736]|uniref:DedA family protein n=1 Tax=Geobacter sp. DSM 9736 TaxID=1277350 RepID=UPI000B4FFC26|nr:DedA family protein [Geobacter sp. DSM 9736]SNB46284.1 membrane protein DedA, SNARE-associated domain [Geobacter sp. DSM 9736]
MSMQDFVTTFGYPALFAGAFLEGETFLFLAGFMAHRGYLDLSLVMLTGFMAAFASDELFFFIGKTKGSRFIDKRPQWRARVEKVRSLLDRYKKRMVLSFRFLYGLRTVSPFVIGMSGFDTREFLGLNAIGAAIWALIMATAGYFFGQALETVMDDVKHHEWQIVAALAAVGVTIWLVRYRLLLRRDSRRAP